MMEIRELRARWQTYRQNLLRADYNHADEELARALYFADKNPLLASVLAQLRMSNIYQTFDADAWLAGRGPAFVQQSGHTNVGFSLDDSERAAQCLKVLELALERFRQSGDGLLSVGETTYGGMGNLMINSIRSAIEVVFDPFHHYVDAELRSRETLLTPLDIVQDIQQLVDTNASVRYPETHKLLLDTYGLLFSLTAGSAGEAWNQVGYRCRDVLIRFANEVFDPVYVPEGQAQPQTDNVKEKLKWVARHFLKQAEAGDRYREQIEAIVRTNWDYISTFAHRQKSTTETDARLAVIYTYLTIWLIDGLVLSQ